MYHSKNIWTLHNKHLRIIPTRIIKGANQNNEAHLITGEINMKNLMIGVNDLITNRTAKRIDQRLNEENFIKLNHYEATHKMAEH